MSVCLPALVMLLHSRMQQAVQVHIQLQSACLAIGKACLSNLAAETGNAHLCGIDVRQADWHALSCCKSSCRQQKVIHVDSLMASQHHGPGYVIGQVGPVVTTLLFGQACISGGPSFLGLRVTVELFMTVTRKALSGVSSNSSKSPSLMPSPSTT